MSKKIRKRLSAREQNRRAHQSGKIETVFDGEDTVQFTKVKGGFAVKTLK